MLQCDGHLPCNRCQDDNVICLFGERDKAQDKTWPRGTVELCLKKQKFYESAIIELYQTILDQQLWKGGAVRQSPDGRPLIHDILAGLKTCNVGPTSYKETTDSIECILRNERPRSASPGRTKNEESSDGEQDEAMYQAQARPLAETRQASFGAEARRMSTRHSRPSSSTATQVGTRPPLMHTQDGRPSTSYSRSAERANQASWQATNVHPYLQAPPYQPTVTQSLNGDSSSLWPANVPLATPNLSPDTESPAATSPFASYVPQSASQSWQRRTYPYSPDYGLPIGNDTLVNDAMFYGNASDERGNLGWMNEPLKQETGEPMLFTMTEDPQREFYGFPGFPFQ